MNAILVESIVTRQRALRVEQVLQYGSEADTVRKWILTPKKWASGYPIARKPTRLPRYDHYLDPYSPYPSKYTAVNKEWLGWRDCLSVVADRDERSNNGKLKNGYCFSTRYEDESAWQAKADRLSAHANRHVVCEIRRRNLFCSSFIFEFFFEVWDFGDIRGESDRFRQNMIAAV